MPTRPRQPRLLQILVLLSWPLMFDATIGRAESPTDPTTSPPPANAVALSSERMMEDVLRLSGPEFSGRQTGTVDDFRSAVWVADRFHSLGLQPAAPNPLQAGVQQPWTMPTATTVPTIPPNVALTLTTGTMVIPLRAGTDYLPVLDSPTIDIAAPVTFVGYGLSDPSGGYDDYNGLDVKGHVVLFLRGKPPWQEGSVSHHAKARTAKRHGAVGYLTVTGPVMTAYEARRGVGTAPLAYYGRQGQDEQEADTLPGAWISVAAADQLLANNTEGIPATLAALQEEINREHRPRSRTSHVEAHLQWEQQRAQGTLHNVVGLLEGTDPALKEDTIVIGAHRDHFGRQAGLLFPGADDNASGTAVILEVARALMASEARPRRSVLFVSFSGEEQGLLGSNFYVERPARPLRHTIAMINIDHAGIGNGRLTIGVTGFEKAVAQRAAESAALADQIDVFGFFPGGDHVPFKEAGIPTVTVVSGGSHPHFHQPSDSAHTVQPEILLLTAKYVLSLANQLAR